jgi:2-hydroxy-6-oxonona-2,4-dienedioate hydrolase
MVGKELSQDASSRGLTDEEIIHIPGLASRWVRLANGARAHYVTSGDTGPAIILLHGGIAGSSGTAGWRFMAPFLGANGFRVFCPDEPGYGWADTREEYWPTLGRLSHTQFIDDFANALCLDRFHLSGNSMGCGNTVQYVKEHPDRIISYAMIATGSMGDLDDPSKRIERKDGKFTPNPNYTGVPFDGTEKTMRELMEGIIYKAAAVWPELITMRTKAAARQKESQEAFRAGNERVSNDPNLAQKLTLKGRFDILTIPAIYLYGKQDVLSPVENAFMQEDALPNIQVFYPDQCGHQGQTDQPEMFNQAFLEFFKCGMVSKETAEWAGVSDRRPIHAHLVDLDGTVVPQEIVNLKGTLKEPATA